MPNIPVAECPAPPPAPDAVLPCPAPAAAQMVAQMRRDRARLADAGAEILALRAQLRRLEGLPPQRAYQQLRRAYLKLPAGLRGVLRPARPATPDIAAPATAGDAPMGDAAGRRGRALIIDDHWPQPDRDSGSVDIVNLAHSLRLLGFEVVLAAARDHAASTPATVAARAALVRDGIRCLAPGDAPTVEDYLARQGPVLDLCVLCRVYCGGRFLEDVLREARHARIVFNSIDLNFLREQRKAELMGDAAALAIAHQVRLREEAIIRGCDATIVVSAAELAFLAREVPEALVAELPLARPLAPPVAGFAARAGIGFIGGFAHAPNVDAVRHFLAETWPLVRQALPEAEFTIVGADFPAALLDGVPGPVRALGQLPEIGPWLETLRLTVAPLRFGAGAKGKVASSLAAGVPCIATPVAAEGMSLAEEAGVLVADTPAAFAAHLHAAYTDAALWQRLSAGGLAHAGAHLSLEGWRARLDGLLRRIGL